MKDVLKNCTGNSNDVLETSYSNVCILRIIVFICGDVVILNHNIFILEEVSLQ